MMTMTFSEEELLTMRFALRTSRAWCETRADKAAHDKLIERLAPAPKPFTMESLETGMRMCASGGEHCGNEADMLCTHCGLRFCFACAGEHEESLS